MKVRLARKILPILLSATLLFQAIGTTVQATTLQSPTPQAPLAEETILCAAHLSHDEDCGFIKADDENGTTEVSCEHICELCLPPVATDPPLATAPPVASAPSTGSDVTTILVKSYTVNVKQNNKEVIEDGKLEHDKDINIEFIFAVPVFDDPTEAGEFVSIGDYATFARPSALTFNKKDEIIVKNDGAEIARVSFTETDFKVTFTGVVDEVGGNLENVSMKFSTNFTYDSSGTNGTEGDHTIDIYGKNFVVNVPKKKTTITGEKNGTADITNGVIDWKIKVSADLEGGAADDGDLDGYIFSDNLKAVGEYVADSLKIDTDQNGSTATAVTPTPTYDPATGLLTYTFEPTTVGTPTVGTRYLFFQTNIPTDKLNGNGDQTISNTAEVKKDGEDTVTFKKDVEFKIELIEKAGAVIGSEYGNDGKYDPTNRKIKWSITANHRAVSLDNVVITDNLPAGLTFESATVQFWDSATDGWGNATTPTKTGGDYVLGNITEKLLLTITTKVDDQTNTATTSFDNTATIKWDDNSGGTQSNTARATIGFSPISKQATGTYNQASHELNWTATVDTKKLPFDASLRVLDLLVYGDKALTESEINSLTIDNNSGASLTQVTAADIKLLTQSLNQRYVLNTFAGTDSTGTVLECTVKTLSKGGKAVADLLVVTKVGGGALDDQEASTFTYKSVITNPDIYASNKKDVAVTNTASLFSQSALMANAEAIHKHTSNMLTKDMLTRENAVAIESNVDNINAVNSAKANDVNGFRYDDKSSIFRFQINANNLTTDATQDLTGVDGEMLGDITFTDTLPKGWEFDSIDSKSILLYEGTSNAGVVTATGSNIAVTAYSSFISDVTIEQPSGDVGGKLSITFTSLAKPYVILIKASPIGETVKEYFSKNREHTLRNTASLENSKFNEPPSSSVDFKIKSSLLGKTVDTSKEDDAYLNWTVNYQPYNVSNGTTHITDALPLGIDLRTDSKGKLDFDTIEANEMTLKADGSYTMDIPVDLSGGGIFEYNSVTREIRFIMPDPSKAYRLTYITDITGESGEKISNQVALFKDSDNQEGVSKEYTISQNASDSSLNRSAWMEITKTDEAGNALAGAEFTLFAEDGVTVIRRGFSGADGKVRFKLIPVGYYILKETKAPDGYISLAKAEYAVGVSKNVATGKFTLSIDGKTGGDSNVVDVGSVKNGTTGDLSLEKVLNGNDTDPNKDFKFTITLTDSVGTLVTGTYTYVKDGVTDSVTFDGNGQATFTLKGGEKVLIKYLPMDTAYTIVIDDYTADGYEVTAKTNDVGVITVDTTQAVSFTSTKNRTPSRPSYPGSWYPPSKPTEKIDAAKLTAAIKAIKAPVAATPTPKTGDETPVGFMALGLILSLIGVLLLCVLKKTKLGNGEKADEKSN